MDNLTYVGRVKPHHLSEFIRQVFYLDFGVAQRHLDNIEVRRADGWTLYSLRGHHVVSRRAA